MAYNREILEHMPTKAVCGRKVEEMEQCPYATLDCQVMCLAEQVHNVNIYAHEGEGDE